MFGRFFVSRYLYKHAFRLKSQYIQLIPMTRKAVALVFVVALAMIFVAVIWNLDAFVSASSSEAWVQTYEGITAEAIIQTNDGGYAAAGNLLLKTDAYGNIEWNQTLSATSLIQTSDGGYALVSGKQLVKTDVQGNVEWNRTLWDGNYAFSLIQTSDGGFAIAGAIGDYRYGEEYFWLTKTDERGITAWSQTYETVMAGVALSVIQTYDGGYAMLGSSSNGDFLLIKTSSMGNLEWSKIYGSQDMDSGHSIVQTEDSGYVLGGTLWNRSNSGNMAAIIKVDSNGTVLWMKNYPGGFRVSMIGASDGSYVLCSDLTLVKIDSEGDMLWAKDLSFAFNASTGQVHSLIQTHDGGYAITGDASSYSVNGQDWASYAWILKTDSEGNYPPLSPSSSPPPSPEISPTQTPTPSLSPRPSASIPEFFSWIILPLVLIAIVSMSLLIKKKKRA